MGPRSKGLVRLHSLADERRILGCSSILRFAWVAYRKFCAVHE